MSGYHRLNGIGWGTELGVIVLLVNHVVLLVVVMTAGHLKATTVSRSNYYDYSAQSINDVHHHHHHQETQTSPKSLVTPPSQHRFTSWPWQEFSTMTKAIRQQQEVDSQTGTHTGHQSGSNQQSSRRRYGNSVSNGRMFIQLSPSNLIEFDILLTMPFTFDYSSLGLGRRRRDVGSDVTMVDDLFQMNLVKLRTVFRVLGVHESECLEEIICVIHRQSKDFYPLPNFISKVLNLDDLEADLESHFNYINSTNTLDYSRYVRAVQRGTNDQSGTCTVSDAPWCSSIIDNILNRPMFKLLQYINGFGKMNIAFKDGT